MRWAGMAVDPTANATWIASHALPLNIGDSEIIEGINEVVTTFDDQGAQPYQRMNLVATGPGSSESLGIRPFGVGQNVTIKNGIGLWIEFSVRGATGTSLSLKPTTQKV
jgi:hypothetical protein